MRRRAEERLKSGAAASQKVLSLDEAHLLLHELQVHQIELEIQNEDLRRALEELESSCRADTALRESEARYLSIIEDQTELICRYTSDGRLSFVNGAYSRYYDKKPEELININFIPHIPEPDISMIVSLLADITPEKPLATYEHRIITPKGEVRWQRWTHRGIYNLAGELVEHQAVGHDITNRKEAEEALRRAHDELEQRVQERTLELQKAHDELEQRVHERTLELQQTHAMLLHVEKLSAIGNLSASIAHEFNNPLQSVMSVIKGVRKRASLAEDDAELVDMAIKECNRMRVLIKSLQDFNRPTSGKMALMDIHSTIDSILLLGKKEYTTKKITVKKDYANHLPRIKAVADQIKQVILNLLNNAVDACENGGTITIRTEADQGNMVVNVQDTGKGIRPEDMAYIFEPFFSTKPAVKGTGLGLSVSYGIVKAHGGEIKMKSEVGKGTIFSVILPFTGGPIDHEENSAG